MQKPWHTRETCWKIHRKPPHLKKCPDGCALQTMAESSQEHQVTSSANSFKKEQLEQLFNLFQSSQFNVRSSCSIVQSGNYPPIALSSANHIPYDPWIIDSGATDHMTSCSKLFSSYNPSAGNQKIKIADGSFSAVIGTGSIYISSSLVLKNVLYVPNLSCNLLFKSKITCDNKCVAKFSPSICEFQETASRRTIGIAREYSGLYFFEDGTNSSNSVQRTCFTSISVSRDREILWHYRLDHPSFHYLKYLFLNSFKIKFHLCFNVKFVL